MRIFSNGQVLVSGSISKSGMNGFEVIGAGVSGATTGFSYPINGYSATDRCGIYGENSGSGQGVLGQNSTALGIGVYGVNNNGGTGIAGFANTGFGVSGQSFGGSSAGVRGFNSFVTGTGIIALGNNISTAPLAGNGSGLAAHGRYIGTYSTSSDVTNGFGLVGMGNGMISFNDFGVGAGVLGAGEYYGIMAFASNSGTPVAAGKWAGYFDYLPSGNGYAWVGGRNGATDYGILSTGVKSTMVKDEQNRNRIMYCTEAPEVLFQDIGIAKLINGKAHIDIDPLLARNIYVSDDKPLKVFIQLEGDCHGVYVTNKSATGFDVIELNGGRSNITFSYQLFGNRADATDSQGRITSNFANTRFPVGPDRLEGKPTETTKSGEPAVMTVPEGKRLPGL
jgi:hypothetical protein